MTNDSTVPVAWKADTASVLRAMARNYSDGHRWDHLDTAACIRAADEIDRLRAAEAVPPASSAVIWDEGYKAANADSAALDSAHRYAESADQMTYKRPTETVNPYLTAGLSDALRMALAYVRWQAFGECRSVQWDGPPPEPAAVDEALVAALAASSAPK